MGLQYAEPGAVIDSLYDRLGGAAVLAAVVDDLVDRLASNPILIDLFNGRDLPQLKAFGVSILSAQVGGPCGAGTSSLTPPRVNMRFSPKELHAAACDMTEALQEQGIGATEAGEVMRLFYAAGSAQPLRSTVADPIWSQERFKNAV